MVAVISCLASVLINCLFVTVLCSRRWSVDSSWNCRLHWLQFGTWQWC